MTKIDAFSLCTIPIQQYAHGKNLGSAREICLHGPNGESLWYVHPQFAKKRIDVVAIPLVRSINDDSEIGLYPINALRSEVDLQIAIGMDVFVLGYPFGFSLPGLPIWKRGSVASEPDIMRLADGYLLMMRPLDQECREPP